VSKYMRFLFLVGMPLFLLTACPPTPVPPPVDADASTSDASVGDGKNDVYGAACGNLARLGCPEGQDTLCHDKLRQVVEADLTHVDLNCVIDSKSAEDVRKCGSTFSCGMTK
jgi:hypothetical protein